MRTVQPIHWYQGLFLQPHHFQLQDRNLQAGLSALLAWSRSFPYGILHLEVRDAALAQGVVDIPSAELIFQDGTHVLLPGNAVLPPRSFRKAWTDTERPFKVFLGLRRWSDAGPNAAAPGAKEELESLGTRYAGCPEPLIVPDLMDNGPVASMKRLAHLVRIFWETEAVELGDYLVLPAMVLTQEGGQVKVSSAFTPPTPHLGCSPLLLEAVKGIRDMVLSQVRHLEEYKPVAGTLATDLGPEGIVYLAALRELTPYAPALCRLLEQPLAHPYEVHGLLRQLVAALSTFSDRVDILGRLPDGRSLLDDYRHEDPLPAFQSLRTLLGELLGGILVGPQHIIDMIREGSVFQGAIPLAAFDGRNDFYLTVRTQSPQREKLLRDLQHIAKLSAPESLSLLLSRALAGIGMKPCLSLPPGLPKHPHALHFRLDQADERWLDVQRSQSLGLYWDEAPEDVRAEIIVLRR